VRQRLYCARAGSASGYTPPALGAGQRGATLSAMSGLPNDWSSPALAVGQLHGIYLVTIVTSV